MDVAAFPCHRWIWLVPKLVKFDREILEYDDEDVEGIEQTDDSKEDVKSNALPVLV